MRRWNNTSILAAILLMVSLVLLSSFLFADSPSGYVADPTDGTTTEETTTETTTVETTTEETTQGETQETPVIDCAVSATHAFVYDVSTGKYLYQKGDPDQHIAPASVTKLFTAYVALQYLEPDTVLTAGSEVEMIIPGSSRAYISKGHQLTVEMCVQGMLLPSGNDAAYMLAVAAGRAIGGKSLGINAALEAFMDKVNQTAADLGMTGTHFVSPDGADRTQHYTTTKDSLVIAGLALRNKTITKYTNVHQSSVVFESGHTAVWVNSNLLLDKSSKYYHPDALGLKTGTTTKAGACLLSAFQGENGLVIIGVFGCPTNETRYEDTLRLYEACSK